MPRPLPSLRRVLILPLLALAACVAPTAPPPSPRPTPLTLHSSPPPVPLQNALPRWRAQFPAFTDAVFALDLDLYSNESADTPQPVWPLETRARLAALSDGFTLGPGETFVFDPISGPETPFPDHQALRMVSAVRTHLARLALADHDLPRALALVAANLTQARASLAAQEGLVPLIHAASVWQSALDSVHALATYPALPEADARRLLATLQADAGLAQLATARALRGEFTYVYRVIVERMPQSDDPELLLSGIACLGMSPPEPLAPGEPGLRRTPHLLLDVPATLAAYEADLAPYLAALAENARLPRSLYADNTAPKLAAYRAELGGFYDYATTDEPPTPVLLERVQTDLEATVNPGGKLLACFLTPYWDSFFILALRREAQRSALCGLLAWRIHGRPAPWAELKDMLPEPPADPFGDGPLRYALDPEPRLWSIYVNSTDDGGQPVESNVGQPPDLVWSLQPSKP